MTATTIDLTTIPPTVFDGIGSIEFDFNDDRILKRAIKAQREAQRAFSQDLFSQWLNETNDKLINDIDVFIQRSLGLEDGLFTHVYSSIIHPAAIILGMQASDHARTLDTIEEHVKKTFKTQVLRLQSGFSKKSNLETSLKQFKNDDRLLVMIEQVEIMDHMLIESLILKLHEMLEESQSKRIMILFFMSGSWKNINLIISSNSMSRMRTIETIVKEPEDVMRTMQKRLMNTEKTAFKLGPNLIDLLYDDFIERDASIVNLGYLYEFAIYEHYSKKVSLLNLPVEKLRAIFKTESQCSKAFKDFEYFKTRTGDKNKSFANIANMIDKQIKHHTFVVIQIQTYFILIRDETHETFPSMLNDIFRELTSKAHKDLAQSSLFLDSISKLKNYPIASLRKRMNECIQARSAFCSKDKFQDVLKIIIEFDDKLENNDNDRRLVSDLTNKLREHAKLLINPFKMQLQEALYYDNVDRLQSRTMPATRYDALQKFLDKSCAFSILYDMIHKSQEEISENDLFGDFSDAMCEMKREVSRVKKFSTALLKAIYLDLIDCMIHQGLVKRELRGSKVGILKRVVWL